MQALLREDGTQALQLGHTPLHSLASAFSNRFLAVLDGPIYFRIIVGPVAIPFARETVRRSPEQ
jgi:hypothetical protein